MGLCPSRPFSYRNMCSKSTFVRSSGVCICCANGMGLRSKSFSCVGAKHRSGAILIIDRSKGAFNPGGRLVEGISCPSSLAYRIHSPGV